MHDYGGLLREEKKNLRDKNIKIRIEKLDKYDKDSKDLIEYKSNKVPNWDSKILTL